MKTVKEKKYILNQNGIRIKANVIASRINDKTAGTIKSVSLIYEGADAKQQDIQNNYAAGKVSYQLNKIKKKSLQKAEQLSTKLAANSVNLIAKGLGKAVKAVGSSLKALIGIGGVIFICAFSILIITTAAVFGGNGGTYDVFAIPFDTTINSIVITDDFGPRIDPITGEESFHHGIDFTLIWHSPILASADGVVTFAGTNESLGNYVIIQHEVFGTTMYTLYAHLSFVNVKEEDFVIQGWMIGLEGGDPEGDPNPGVSTGDHLHFAMMDSGRNYVVPKVFLSILD